MAHYDFFLAHASPDKARVRELRDALVATGRRAFLDEAELQPGDRWDLALAEALRASRIVVVLVSRHYERAHYLADEVQSAVAQHRLGHQRVVPVFVDGLGTRPPYGLGVFQGIDLDAVGVDGVVAELVRLAGPLDEEVDGLVAAVVGVDAELADELAAAAVEVEVGGRFAAVRRIDPAEPAALDRARRADLRVVLVGASTGGPAGEAVLATLLGDTDRVVAAALEPVPRARRKQYRAEYDAAMDLGDGCALRFGGADDVGRVLRDALAAWEPPAEDEEASGLQLWERRYLVTRLPAWRAGTGRAFDSMSALSELTREPLYVSLHADLNAWARYKQQIVPVEMPSDGRVRETGGLLPRRLLPRRRERLIPDGLLRRGRQSLKPAFLDEVLSVPDVSTAVVIGEAGTGKSVLLQHVATTLACALLGRDPPAEARLDLDTLGGPAGRPPVPVLIEARALDPHLQRDRAGGLVAALAAELDTTPDDAEAALAAGRLLVLVDSLDEVPSIAGRKRVLVALTALADLHEATRLVLTTRPVEHTASPCRRRWCACRSRRWTTTGRPGWSTGGAPPSRAMSTASRWTPPSPPWPSGSPPAPTGGARSRTRCCSPASCSSG